MNGAGGDDRPGHGLLLDRVREVGEGAQQGGDVFDEFGEAGMGSECIEVVSVDRRSHLTDDGRSCVGYHRELPFMRRSAMLE